MAGAGLSRSRGSSQTPPASQPAKITIDYPLDGSVFPPEITPPTFLWRDASDVAQRWVVQVSFADHSEAIRLDAPGEHLQMGEIDKQTGTGAELAQLNSRAGRHLRKDQAILREIARHEAILP
jgi:hypothetical protein